MQSGDERSRCVLGFYSVLAHEQLGLVGGYLLLNTAGRPLEFHCTAPIRANRAQQILFGPTLDTFMYGEQLGQTLVSKGSVQPDVICTDVAKALTLREFVEPVVVLVKHDAPPSEHAASPWRPSAFDSAGSPMFGMPLCEFEIGRNRLAVSSDRAADQQLVQERLASMAQFDLCEPFARIRAAIEEAHRNTRAA